MNFNKYLKDVVVLTEEKEYSIQFMVYDFKLLSRSRDFIVAEKTRDIVIGGKSLFVSSINSISPNFEYRLENSKRCNVISSGYFVTETDQLGESLLGFWIECEVTKDENLQEIIMKDYLSHLKSLRMSLP